MRDALQARTPDADLDGDVPGDAAVVALFVLSLCVLGLFVARQLAGRSEPLVHTTPVGGDDTDREGQLDEELRRFEVR